MRGRTLAATAAAALTASALVAAALFPLSLALRIADAPIDGRPSGRVWNGTIDEASLRGVELGTLRLRPSVLALLSGRLRSDVSMNGPAGSGEGVLSPRGGALTVHKWEGRLSLHALGALDPFGRPLRGTAAFEVHEAVLTREGCQSGTVSAATDALQRATNDLASVFAAPTLAGTGTCRGGVLMLPLRGEGPAGRVAVDLRLSGGGYVSDLIVSPSDPRAGPFLTRYGFQRTPDGYSLLSRGDY